MTHYHCYRASVDPYAVDLSRLGPVLDRYVGTPTTLSALLGDVRDTFGYLPLAALAEVAHRTNRPMSVVQRVACGVSRSRSVA